ncbi:ATP-binding protein [Nocardiopsis trehalosi]|jgi:anti-sigma regulatory factor (Ser/Thr protein kinase)|uniref:ATP-binding protein n=1 Tax=Nocardiopsis trehalosi TaxID=109329 RepID=UPI00082C8566|nr:ATP-binding protein [Nocardiopsis trehalosi]
MTPPFRRVPRPCRCHVRVFTAVPEQVADARSWAVALLPRPPARVADAVRLAVSEAATNAVRHSVGPDYRLHVTVGRACARSWVYVQCEDRGGPTVPRSADVPHWSETGRGLHLISAVTDLSGPLAEDMSGIYFFLSWSPGAVRSVAESG